ncbi:branched-chain amino acid ABC transporter permease [Histidinibacterium aquaticum]|uniref:Branched-chain amino acid ABC transporter permease n=1 Tax=Histidinibacterium aquaticum TaxID=2613962 RepID=A0A5J5GJ83_9RHOB|nr:branched-chain amino acid ABC transporter permease [Histidinibacterium aquaticum]KAA9008110.1 branched-chain amino acid ABC transporter permease [Histidinibacterium aquaticum]
MAYLYFSLALVAVYIGITLLLHLQFGRVGIVNFGVVGFWGLGMYAHGVFMVTLGLPWLVALLLATLLVGLFALALGALVLRLDGQSVLVATLAFATIVLHLVTTEKWLTGGVVGFGTIEYPFDFGAATEPAYLALILAFVAVVLVYALRLDSSAYGRLLSAIRDNEPLAHGLGKPTFRHKLIFFAVTSAGMGLFGGLSASLNQFLTPNMIAPGVTFTAWIALVLGGKDHPWGAIIGVCATVGLFDVFIETFAPIPADYALLVPNIKLMLYGAFLVVIMLYRPSGVLGGYGRRG